MTTWLPLESNPEVMNEYIRKIGVPTKWSLTDVYGLEPEMLEWVPKPVKAVMLLFPCSDAYEKYCCEEEKKLKENPPIIPKSLFYMKQVIHNACGTIALVHSIANNESITLNDGILKNYINKSKDLTPEERGKLLETDEAFTNSHHELAQEGQTAPNPEEKVYYHFVTFVHKDGILYELDGRKSYPIAHGNTTEENILQDSAKICKEYMARDPNEVHYTVIALTEALK